MPEWYRVDVSLAMAEGNTPERAERIVREALEHYGFPQTGIVIHNVEEENE
jgi:GTP cyclohydrolase III